MPQSDGLGLPDHIEWGKMIVSEREERFGGIGCIIPREELMCRIVTKESLVDSSVADEICSLVGSAESW